MSVKNIKHEKITLFLTSFCVFLFVIIMTFFRLQLESH